MSMAIAYGSGALAVLKRDILIFTSYRARLFTQVFSVFLTVLLFYYVSRLVSVERFTSPDQYFSFVVVGIVTMRSLATTFTTTVTTVRQELVAGTFERMLSSPFGAVAGAISDVLFPIVLAFWMALMTLAFAVFAFGLEVQWDTVALALPIAALAALAAAPFAFFITAITIVFKQGSGLTGFLLAGIAVAAGVFFPVELLPGWIRWMAEVQPFTPTIELLRYVITGIPLEDPAWELVAKIAAFAAVLLPLSYLALRGAVAIGRRRATITEY